STARAGIVLGTCRPGIEAASSAGHAPGSFLVNRARPPIPRLSRQTLRFPQCKPAYWWSEVRPPVTRSGAMRTSYGKRRFLAQDIAEDHGCAGRDSAGVLQRLLCAARHQRFAVPGGVFLACVDLRRK